MEPAGSDLPLPMSLLAEANRAFFEQPQLKRWVHGRMFEPTPKKVIPAGNESTYEITRPEQELLYLVEKLVRAELVGIHEEHPRVPSGGVIESPISLVSEV